MVIKYPGLFFRVLLLPKDGLATDVVTTVVLFFESYSSDSSNSCIRGTTGGSSLRLVKGSGDMRNCSESALSVSLLGGVTFLERFDDVAATRSGENRVTWVLTRSLCTQGRGLARLLFPPIPEVLCLFQFVGTLIDSYKIPLRVIRMVHIVKMTNPDSKWSGAWSQFFYSKNFDV